MILLLLLKGALKDLLQELHQESQNPSENLLVPEDATKVSEFLSLILAEVKELRKDKSNLKAEVTELKKENEALKDSVFQHQRFLESIDAEKRSQNLIITGLSEESDLTIPESVGAPSVIANCIQMILKWPW